jgi:hypothetical protein
MRPWIALVAGALDDRRVVAVDLDLLGHAKLAELDLVEVGAEVLHDRGRRR